MICQDLTDMKASSGFGYILPITTYTMLSKQQSFPELIMNFGLVQRCLYSHRMSHFIG